MMSYLKVLVVLFLATAITVSAVQLDGYHVLEKQKVTENGETVTDENGDPVTYTVYKPDTDEYVEKQETEGGDIVTDSDGEPVTEKVVVKRLKATDTSNFSSLKEYRNLIDNHIAIDSSSGSPYATYNGSSLTLLNTVQEMLDREVAEPADVLVYSFIAVRDALHIDSIAPIQPSNLSNVEQSIKNIASVDTSEVDKLDTSLPHLSLPVFTKTARLIFNHHSDTKTARSAFDVIWTSVDKTFDTDAPLYKRCRIRGYHIPLEQYEKGYNLCLELVEKEQQVVFALDQVANTDIPATEELLWKVVDSVGSKFYTVPPVVPIMITYWDDGIDWNSYTPQEALDICNKYLMTMPVNETTAPFVMAIKEKRRTMKDMID